MMISVVIFAIIGLVVKARIEAAERFVVAQTDAYDEASTTTTATVASTQGTAKPAQGGYYDLQI